MSPEPDDEPSADPALERAAELLDEGRVEETLELLERASPERGERWLLTCDALLELGAIGEAERALEEARARLGPEDTDLAWYEGRIHLFRWRLDAARSSFAKLDPEVEGVPLLENLAILADAEGDHEGAHRLLSEAHEKSSGRRPAPLWFEPEAFEELVSEAAAELPDDFRQAFEEVAVVIDPMPTPAVVGAPASGHPPDVLGLFVGLSANERDGNVSGELPPTIFLFQRNLERIATDPEELRDEIRVTLYHELGHALGFDEDGVDAMGLA